MLKKKRSLTNRFCPRLEQLEDRRTPAVNLSTANGILSVTGTPAGPVELTLTNNNALRCIRLDSALDLRRCRGRELFQKKRSYTGYMWGRCRCAGPARRTSSPASGVGAAATPGARGSSRRR